MRKAIKEKCMEFMKNAEQRNKIGEGGFGQISTIQFKGHKPILVKKTYKNVEKVSSIVNETLLLYYCDNRYLPDLIYSGYDVDGKWCTVMQFYSGGSLDYHIKGEIFSQRMKLKLRINLEQKIYIAYHLALALEYLHGRKWTHG